MPLAFQRRSDLGVDERHPLRLEPIRDESDHVRAATGLVALQLGVVRDYQLDRGGHLSTLATGRSAMIGGD